jgi:hypothetical protein
VDSRWTDAAYRSRQHLVRAHVIQELALETLVDVWSPDIGPETIESEISLLWQVAADGNMAMSEPALEAKFVCWGWQLAPQDPHRRQDTADALGDLLREADEVSSSRRRQLEELLALGRTSAD